MKSGKLFILCINQKKSPKSNVINFGVDMSSSVHVDNKKKGILILGKGPTKGFEHILTAAKMYSINFTVTKNTFCLGLHYNGTEIYKLKQKT